MESSEEQKRIIQDKNNIVVTARPGSGKTYTIVEKIQLILEELYNYQGIIAISFTNKASEELRKRCSSRGLLLNKSFFGTIDKFCFSEIIAPFCSHLSDRTQDLKIKKYKKTDGLENLDKKNDDEIRKIVEEYLRQDIVFLELLGETALYILERVPDATRYLCAKYKAIFIDEYQDCDRSQNAIFLYLVDQGIKGMAVGDSHQAIYGFTKKNSVYLEQLTKDPNFTHYNLSKNFRCHPSIYQYALSLYGKAEGAPEDKKRVFRVKVDGNEKNIAQKIEENIPNIKRQYDLKATSGFAILCRNNSTVDILNKSLTIPHKIYTKTKLDADNSDIARLFVQLIRGYFDENIYALDITEHYFLERNKSNKYLSLLNATQKLFACSINELVENISLFVHIAQIIYPNQSVEDMSETLNRLKDVLMDKHQYENYMPPKEDEISIMTIHKSKGLEFNVIFQMDMYDYIFPKEIWQQGRSPESWEQDLNLHYVAITRAKVACYLMEGSQRYNGKGILKSAKPSPFYDLPGVKKRRCDVKW